jgi:large subunit ribosomal protein L21
MFAIVDFKGIQLKVEKNQKLQVPYMKEMEIGNELEMGRVLLLHDGANTVIGKPIVANAVVTAEVLGHSKGKKIIIFKKKRRKGYRVKNGHRQNFTEIVIKDIK